MSHPCDHLSCRSPAARRGGLRAPTRQSGGATVQPAAPVSGPRRTQHGSRACRWLINRLGKEAGRGHGPDAGRKHPSPGSAGPFGKSGGGEEGWSPPPDVCPSVPCPHTAGRLPGRRASCSLQDDPLGKGDSAEERGGGWTEPAPLLAARRRRGRARREQVSAVAGRVFVIRTVLAVAGLVVVTASTPCADRDTAGPVSRRARGLRAARSERWLRVSVR